MVLLSSVWTRCERHNSRDGWTHGSTGHVLGELDQRDPAEILLLPEPDFRQTPQISEPSAAWMRFTKEKKMWGRTHACCSLVNSLFMNNNVELCTQCTDTSRADMRETSVTFGARSFTDVCGCGLLTIDLCSGAGFPECCILQVIIPVDRWEDFTGLHHAVTLERHRNETHVVTTRLEHSLFWREAFW